MIHRCPLTPIRFAVTFNEWQDSLRVDSVITKSTHFVALPEYPRNSPHRAAWVSFLSCHSSLNFADRAPCELSPLHDDQRSFNSAPRFDLQSPHSRDGSFRRCTP